MTEDRAPKVTDEPTIAARQRPERKKWKWDQPAEDLVSAAARAAAVAGLPLMNIGALPSIALPGSATIPAATLPNVVPVPSSLPPHIAPSVLQNAAAVLQKLSQANLPDEIIAREIVINDADPSVRYKLTKRQTRKEIQRCTSTVIITRGKYYPPNRQPNGEKPLYLHISAGSQVAMEGPITRARTRQLNLENSGEDIGGDGEGLGGIKTLKDAQVKLEAQVKPISGLPRSPGTVCIKTAVQDAYGSVLDVLHMHGKII